MQLPANKTDRYNTKSFAILLFELCMEYAPFSFDPSIADYVITALAHAHYLHGYGGVAGSAHEYGI